MSEIQLRDVTMNTCSQLPELNQPAPKFALVAPDLSQLALDDLAGRPVLINVYPSIDTSVCFDSVKQFSQQVKAHQDLVILCVSMDLPFALKRVAAGEQLHDIVLLSDYCNRDFGASYGLTIVDGPIAGLLARAVFVLDKQHRIVYRELVQDVSQPPSYDSALAAVQKIT